ncbi:unnamed protein product [Prorocentrum cordatum]|uniref:Uncharacterized protein n=1 Tax=Prorocentrum cordatum TaxID=2364126 RepID=A0ABN9TXB7_9DINO|nr:unnamed protein product [Polarella glacialis]
MDAEPGTGAAAGSASGLHPSTQGATSSSAAAPTLAAGGRLRRGQPGEPPQARCALPDPPMAPARTQKSRSPKLFAAPTTRRAWADIAPDELDDMWQAEPPSFDTASEALILIRRTSDVIQRDCDAAGAG